VVLFDLSPRLVMGHFVLSMLIVWNAVVLHHRAGRASSSVVRVVSERVHGAARVVFGAAAVVVLTGTVVTASGPHAGDEQAERLDLVVRDVARIHSVAVWLLVAVVLVTLRWMRSDGAPPRVLEAGQALLGAILLQGAIGYMQYLTGVPVFLVWFHIVGALLVWTAAVRLNLVLSESPADASGDESSEDSRQIVARTAGELP
jgi:cytochrome c oxidase assembly protein subunit 15